MFAVLVIGHFAVPFFALLSRPLKRRPTALAVAGGWLVAMHYVDVYWLVMPVLHAAPRCTGSTWRRRARCSAWRPRWPRRAPARAVIDDNDPRFAAAVAYEGT